jgi:phosphoesterase RecJ-like protein
MIKEKSSVQQIAERIKRAKKVAIFTHLRPDGDALGCSLALSLALDFLNIKNTVFDESPMPSNLTFLPDLERVKNKLTEEYDLYIALDCADLSRLGCFAVPFEKAGRKFLNTVNIDHHVSNPLYAQYNFVRNCASNCLNVALLIDALGVPLTKQIAEYLLTGLLTDSGNFSHDDVNEECLLLAAKLVNAGADIKELNYQLFKKQPKQRAKLHGEVMSKIRYYHEDKFAAIVITLEMMERLGADNGMTEGFVDFPLSVDTVEVAASIMEVKRGQYKISLRSKTYADVNKIAGVYGGGGHVRASGCMLFGDIEEILDKLSYTVYQYL